MKLAGCAILMQLFLDFRERSAGCPCEVSRGGAFWDSRIIEIEKESERWRLFGKNNPNRRAVFFHFGIDPDDIASQAQRAA